MSLFQRIHAKIHQPSNSFEWQIEAKKKQNIILDFLKISKDPTHPQLFYMYEQVAKMGFLGFLPNLVTWALDSYRIGVTLYKFPNFVKDFKKLEQNILDQQMRQMNPFLPRVPLELDDDLFF